MRILLAPGRDDYSVRNAAIAAFSPAQGLVLARSSIAGRPYAIGWF
ncbi:hypothetical protein MINT15_16170 [Saccharomonospora viridis]|uniref:Uncharacterized protein n=1 Tax=Saccharomonospora viridis TaxID=1852 RepID=A0A837DC02_9PSEU|nr:hypothetical protein MINT15_16170 [Saccharomonospora viridis]